MDDWKLIGVLVVGLTALLGLFKTVYGFISGINETIEAGMKESREATQENTKKITCVQYKSRAYDNFR